MMQNIFLYCRQSLNIRFFLLIFNIWFGPYDTKSRTRCIDKHAFKALMWMLFLQLTSIPFFCMDIPEFKLFGSFFQSVYFIFLYIISEYSPSTIHFFSYMCRFPPRCTATIQYVHSVFHFHDTTDKHGTLILNGQKSILEQSGIQYIPFQNDDAIV